MPKGRRGCWKCGGLSTHMLQVWLRELDRADSDRDARGGRRQYSVDSAVRSLCFNDAVDLYNDACGHLSQDRGGPGCAVCGERSETRLQVWLRTKDGSSMYSRSRSFCQEHGYAIYSAASELLDRTTLRSCPTNGGDMSAARARMARRSTA